MNTCRWNPTHIFPKEYAVSENGDVLSIRTGRVLKPADDKYGYLYYVLCVDGERRTVKAHRLVAYAFIDNPHNKPSIDHINGDKKDNRVGNLRWVTNKENSNNPITLDKLVSAAKKRMPQMYAEAVKNNFNRKAVRIVWNDGREEVFQSVKSAAEKTKTSYSKLSEILNGKIKQNKKFVASFIQPEKHDRADCTINPQEASDYFAEHGTSPCMNGCENCEWKYKGEEE